MALKFNDEFYQVVPIRKKCGTSVVWKTTDGESVFKKIIRYDEHDLFKREMYMLKFLQDKVDWSPKLISYDEERKIIQMSYCGESFNFETCTDRNILKQIRNIIEDMNRLKFKHNDIKNNQELLLKDGKVYLCDFGWASINDDHSCEQGLWNGQKNFFKADAYILGNDAEYTSAL